MDRPCGAPFRLSEIIGGAVIMAIKAASKKGTRMAAAAFIPAQTITKAARIVINRAMEDCDV